MPARYFGTIVSLLLLVGGRLPAQAPASTVDVHYPSGDVRIAATLHRPAGIERAPAIVLIHGAEGMPRSSPMYVESANFFTSLGFAVLVWDKRGIGGTPGTYIETRAIDESARDVLAGVAYLRDRPDIDPDRVGVYGVSQGGWIGPAAAAMSRTVAFVIANSGPGVSIMESNIAQRANEWIEDGYTPADTAEIKPFLRTTWRYFGTGEGYEAARAARDAVRDRPWFTALGFADSTPAPAMLSDARYDFHRRSQFDPDSVLRKVGVPILAVFGARDRHIPMPESATRFRAALEAGGNRDATVQVFPEAGHGVRKVAGEMERLRRTEGGHGGHELDPGLRPLLAEWLRERFGEPGGR